MSDDDKKTIAKLEAELSSLKARKEAKLRKKGLRTVDGKISFEMTDREKEIEFSKTTWMTSGRMTIQERSNLIYNDWVCDPPEKSKIPKEGAWVMIIRPPWLGKDYVGMKRATVFFAVHQKEKEVDEAGFAKDGHYKIQIFTPWGTPCLWPHEYSRVDYPRLFELYATKELVFKPFTDIVTTQLGDVVHYIRSRGIGLEEALPMALGSIKKPVGWFCPAPEVEKMIEDAYGEVA